MFRTQIEELLHDVMKWVWTGRQFIERGYHHSPNPMGSLVAQAQLLLEEWCPLPPSHKQHPIAKTGPQGIWSGSNSLLTVVCPSNFACTNPPEPVHLIPMQGLALIRLYVTKRSLACPAWREEHPRLSKQYPPARSHCTWDIGVLGALCYKWLLFLLHLELVI